MAEPLVLAAERDGVDPLTANPLACRLAVNLGRECLEVCPAGDGLDGLSAVGFDLAGGVGDPRPLDRNGRLAGPREHLVDTGPVDEQPLAHV